MLAVNFPLPSRSTLIFIFVSFVTRSTSAFLFNGKALPFFCVYPNGITLKVNLSSIKSLSHRSINLRKIWKRQNRKCGELAFKRAGPFH